MTGKLKIILVGLAAVLSVALTSTGASAAPAGGGDVGIAAFECGAGYSCYYYDDAGATVNWEAPSCGVFTFGANAPAWMDNQIEALRNRGGGSVTLYSGYYGSGTNLGTYVNNGQNRDVPSQYDNLASSVVVNC